MDESVPPPPPPPESLPPTPSAQTSSPISELPEALPARGNSTQPTARKRLRAAFVELQSLAASRREQYKPLSDTMIGIKRDIDEVIGEYASGDTLFYFARSKGGIAYRVRVHSFYL